jgi:hypothetical protein
VEEEVEKLLKNSRDLSELQSIKRRFDEARP